MRRWLLCWMAVLLLLVGAVLPAGFSLQGVAQAYEEAAWSAGREDGKRPIGQPVSQQREAASRFDASVVINEFVAKGTEWIELHNPTGSPVDIGGWTVISGYGGAAGPLNYTVPSGTVVPPGGYYTFNTGADRLSNDGDILSLSEPGAPTPVDAVGYGMRGGAPIPPTGYSCARTPNGWDSDDWARDWNLDDTPTQGAANDAAGVSLGSSLRLNEFDNYPPASGNDKVEIYNPTAVAIDLNGWYLSDGDAVAPIVTHPVAPPGGWVVLEETVDWTGSVDFASADVGYLFLPDRTRVDQIGWYNEYEDNTFQRICDGEGPSDGYDWASSGGGRTWYDLPQTLGNNNCAPYSVDAAVLKSGPATVFPGQRITYTLSLSMQTPRRGEGLVVTDTLPAQVAFVTFTSLLPVTWTGSFSPVVFQAGRLYGFQQNTISLVAQVAGDAQPGSLLTNTVALYCPGDVNPANDQDDFGSRVVGSDVAIAKTGPAFRLMGEPISYTLTYEVLGEPAQGVVITDVLPAAVSYVGDTAPVAPSQPVTGTLVWSLGTVSETGSFVVYGLVSSDPMTWTIRNRAEVSAVNDSWPGNNHSYWDTELPMPIAEVQAPSDPSGTWPSRHVGEHVYVVGVVVADSQAYPSAAGNPVRYVLADPVDYGPWKGLFVYDPGRVVTEGQLLVLGGTVDEYYGMTELGAIDYFQVLGEWTPPPAVLTSTAALTTSNPLQAEPLESVLVEVRCTRVTHPDLGFGEWGIADESGAMARVDDLGDYAYVPQLGDVLWSVRGVLFYTYNDYKIEPRYDADILLAPTVQGTEPPDGATNVLVDVVIRAHFNLPLDPATVNPTTYFLEGPAGVVSGTVAYDPASYTAVLTPATALDYASLYVARLTTGIQSAGGAPMCSEYLWSFTTQVRPEPNLTPSFKVASSDLVHPGETFTYTIRLINVGNADAWATITDILPLAVTPITATLPPGMVYQDGLLLWSGQVPQATQLPLAFQVEVDPRLSQGGTITNTVWIADGIHAPFSREAYGLVEVPRHVIYLPLVFRAYNP